jgi:hypothetical protein
VSKAFTAIAATDMDGKSPVTQTRLQQYHDRDEALISGPIDTRFAEVSTGVSSYTEVARVPLWIPPQAGTTAGDITLVVHFQRKVSTGNGRVRMRLGGSGTWMETASFSNTSYAHDTLTIPAADVLAAKDSTVDLIVEAKDNGGGATTFVKCESSASRLERAA